MQIFQDKLSPPTLAEVKNLWWYYPVELEDGSITNSGIYKDGEERLPHLPRIMQRRVDMRGQSVLDVGSAEGMLPILAMKGGAKVAVATDHAAFESEIKLRYLAALHGVRIEDRIIGRAANIGSLAADFPQGFDYINLSGLLYHVTSPIDVLMAARSLLRPNGLMLVSTIYVPTEDCTMTFNDRGHLQAHCNVFWYLSLGFYEYMLRAACLEPIDAMFMGDENGGYASVLCRATAQPVRIGDDPFLQTFLRDSVEAEDLRQAFSRKLPTSDIRLKPGAVSADMVRRSPDRPCVNLFASRFVGAATAPAARRDTRIFMRADQD